MTEWEEKKEGGDMVGGVLRVRTVGRPGEDREKGRGRKTRTVERYCITHLHRPQLSYTAFVCSHNCVIVSLLNGPKGRRSVLHVGRQARMTEKTERR